MVPRLCSRRARSSRRRDIALPIPASALGLGIGYVVVLLTPPMQAFFQLISPAPREAMVVILAVAAWVVLVRTFWAYRVVDRFLGRA